MIDSNKDNTISELAVVKTKLFQMQSDIAEIKADNKIFLAKQLEINNILIRHNTKIEEHTTRLDKIELDLGKVKESYLKALGALAVIFYFIPSLTSYITKIFTN